MMTNKNTNNILVYVLISFAFLITLNALFIRYPVNIILPLLKATSLLVIIFIYGFAALLLFKGKEEMVDFFNACGMGLIITTCYFYLLSFLKILVPITILLFYLIPLILFFFLFKRKKELVRFSLQTFLKRPAKEYIIFLFPLIYASLPPSFYDSLVYHLGIPNFYIQHHGFLAAPQFFFANTSIYYEISLIPAVFAGDLVPQLFHFLLGMVFLLTLIDVAVRFFHLKKRFILLLILLSMPITVFLLSTVKNDLLSAFFILAGINYYLENKFKRSALCWGFSIGIKYFNILPLGIFLLLVFIKQKKLNFKVLIITCIIITVTLLPLFIKNYVFSKNPVFPFFGKYFPQENPYFDASRFAAIKSDVGQVIHSLKDLFKLPYTLSFYELGSGGLIGAQFLIFLPFLILMKKKPDQSFLLVLALVFLLPGFYFSSQARFMYAAFVLLAIFTAIVYEFLDETYKMGMVSYSLKFFFFLIIVLNLATSFGYQERIYRAYYLYSGKSASVGEYLEVVFPSYPAFDFVNKNTPENAVVLLVGEARNYYLKRPYFVSSGVDYSIIKKYISAGPAFQNFIAALKQDKIAYIIYNDSEFRRLQKEYGCLSDDELAKSLDFFNRLKPIFKDAKGNLYVYEII